MFSDPVHNIQQFHLTPHMSVADLGSGTGFYTIAAAEVLRGGEGKVYAIDVQKELLERLRHDADLRNLTNIEIIWGNVEKHQGTKLRNESIDAAIVANTLFQLDDMSSCVKEVARILKPGGKVLVVDWTESFGGMGPVDGHVIDAGTARSLFTDHGFVLEREIEAGAHHYGFIFHKA